MKVLVCIPCLLTGGTEIQTLNLVQALIEGGHKVSTACYFEHSDEMVERYRNAGSEVILMNPDGSRINGWRMIPFLFHGLRKALRQCKPDIAHVQYMAPGAIPIILLKLLGCQKIIATTHTAADIYSSLRLVHFIHRHCVRAFQCISETAEKSFFGHSQMYDESFTLKKRNHFTIYNALPKGFTIRQEKKEFKTPVTLGVVSRLERIKGMDLVIPAYARIRQEFPDTKLIIVGDGSLRQSMAQQADALNCSSAITWLGRQSQEQLPTLYKQIDILLMPSRSEGFGLTAIEGMANGCVVVASNTGGLPEVVKDCETGLIHKPEAIDDMAEKISHLIFDKTLLQRLSDNAVKHAQQYSFSRYSMLVNNLYSKLSK